MNIVGYHGTCKLKKNCILLSRFRIIENDKESQKPWFGDGIYFFNHPINELFAYENAKWWVECPKRLATNCQSILKSIINVDKVYVFDLFANIEHSKEFSRLVKALGKKARENNEFTTTREAFQLLLEDPEFTGHYKLTIVPTSGTKPSRHIWNDVISNHQIQMCVWDPRIIVSTEEVTNG